MGETVFICARVAHPVFSFFSKMTAAITDPLRPPVQYQDNPAEYAEWRQFLYQYFASEWERTGGAVTLEQVYPIAKKRFEIRHKSCDIELNLMANRRKHKKPEKSRG